MDPELVVFFATAWGTRFGGINSFNMDLLGDLAGLTSGKYTIVCVVLNAEPKEVSNALSKGVRLIPLVATTADGRFDKTLVADAWMKLQTAFNNPRVSWWVGHDIVSGAAANRAREISEQGQSAVIKHMSYRDYTNYEHNSARKAQEKYQDQKNVFENANKLFAVGPLLRSRLQEMVVAQDITMLIPGLHAELSRQPNTSTFTAVTFGRLDPRNDRIKQGRLAVEAFANAVKLANRELDRPACLRKNPEMYLFGIDDDPEENEEMKLKMLAQDRAGRAVNLFPLPYVEDRNQLFSVLCKSSVALMLSWHEGFGLSGWEAIAAEVPLITGIRSGLFEFIDEELGGAGVGCLHPIDVQGALGERGEPHYTPETLEEVTKRLLVLASNMPKVQRDARTLKELLLQKGLHGSERLCA